MACAGDKERRDGLIADMVKLREKLTVDELIHQANQRGIVQPIDVAGFGMGYLVTALDKLAAAVIALAGPCCDDCDNEPKQGWSNPDHDIMADLREARDGILANRDGASDE